MKMLMCAVCGLLTGCGALGPNYQDMIASQISAATKDRSSTVVCSKIPTPWGIAEITAANLDNANHSGGGEIIVKCGGVEVSSRDAGRASPVPK